MKLAIILTIVLSVIGFLPLMGIPGALLLILINPFLNLIYGPYAAEFALRSVSDAAWPLMIMISIAWPITIIPGYLLTRLLFAEQSPYKFPSVVVLCGIVLVLSVLVGSVIYIAQLKPRRLHGSDLMVEAAIHDNAGLIKRLHKEGVDANKPDSLGKVAIFQAIENHSPKAVEALLESGVNPNQSAAWFISPLWRACEWGDVRMIKALLAHGATPVFKNREGEKLSVVFAVGSQRGDASEVDLLTKAGADFKVKNKKDQTPLMLFLNNAPDKKTDVLYGTALLNTGIDINAQDVDGNTALHYAIGFGSTQWAEKLISRGANTQIKNKKGQLPAEMAGKIDQIAEALPLQ